MSMREAVQAYERLYDIEKRLRLPNTPPREAEALGRDALGSACIVLRQLRDLAELGVGWEIAAASGRHHLDRLLHDEREMLRFLQAELEVLHASGLSAEPAIATITTCIQTLSEDDIHGPVALTPRQWHETFFDVLEATCTLGEVPNLEEGLIVRGARNGVAAAGGAVVIVANVAAIGTLPVPGLAEASVLLGGETIRWIRRFLRG